MALDRVDIAYSVKELMRKLSSPDANDMEKLKRVARYLVGRPRVYQEFEWQRYPMHLDAYTDSDFAGCSKTRKSTTGGCVMWGGHCLKGWSNTQAIIALSSGEAELAALVKGSVELMGMRSIMQDFGYQESLGLSTDATAAIWMVTREGLGKVRHLAVADLWVQER